MYLLIHAEIYPWFPVVRDFIAGHLRSQYLMQFTCSSAYACWWLVRARDEPAATPLAPANWWYMLCKHATISWWRHEMKTFSALLAISAGNLLVTGEFPAQRPVTRRFGAFFYLRLNNRLSKQSWGWWFGTPSRPLWRHCNDTSLLCILLLWILLWIWEGKPASNIQINGFPFLSRLSC